MCLVRSSSQRVEPKELGIIAVPISPSQSNQCTGAKAQPPDSALASNPRAVLEKGFSTSTEDVDSFLQASCAF